MGSHVPGLPEGATGHAQNGLGAEKLPQQRLQDAIEDQWPRRAAIAMQLEHLDQEVVFSCIGQSGMRRCIGHAKSMQKRFDLGDMGVDHATRQDTIDNNETMVSILLAPIHWLTLLHNRRGPCLHLGKANMKNRATAASICNTDICRCASTFASRDVETGRRHPYSPANQSDVRHSRLRPEQFARPTNFS